MLGMTKLEVFKTGSGEKIRFKIDKDGSWIMNEKLARQLVNEGKWFFVSLWSGTQTPIISAVRYLAETSDQESIPRLKKLLTKYLPGMEKTNKSYEWEGFAVTVHYGPGDYMPQAIQRVIVEALLKLLPLAEAKELVENILDQSGISSLDDWTISVLIGFATKNQMTDISPLLLKQGKDLKEKFDRQSSHYRFSRSGGLSYDNLYGYENLVFGAYKLSTDDKEKAKTLQILIEEYNHPDAYNKGRTHDHIDTMMCELVNRELASDKEKQNQVISQLNPKRFKKDMEYYRALQS